MGAKNSKPCCNLAVPFKSKAKEFDSEHHVRLWMLDNQLARRNITDFTRGKLSLMKKPSLEAISKDKKIESGKTYGEGHKKEDSEVSPNLVKPLDTQKLVCKLRYKHQPVSHSAD